MVVAATVAGGLAAAVASRVPTGWIRKRPVRRGQGLNGEFNPVHPNERLVFTPERAAGLSEKSQNNPILPNGRYALVRVR
jgi:hypothetical protein